MYSACVNHAIMDDPPVPKKHRQSSILLKGAFISEYEFLLV